MMLGGLFYLTSRPGFFRNRMMNEVICVKHGKACPFDDVKNDYVCPLCEEEKRVGEDRS